MIRYLTLLALVLAAGVSTAQTTAPAGPCDAAFNAFAADHDVDAAIAGYQRCLPRAPKTARYNLGVLYAGTEEWARAIEQFREYLKLDATSARATSVQDELTVLAQLQRDYPTAEHVQQFRHDRLLRQSQLFLRAGMNEEAELLARRAAQLSGGTYDDYVALAAAAAAKREFDVAGRWLDEANTVAPANKKAAVGELRAGVNRESMIATLRKGAEAALKTDPKRAAELLASAWELAPERGDIGFAAAVAYLASPDAQMALPILEKLSSGKDAALAVRARKLDADVRRLLVTLNEKRAQQAKTLAALLKSTNKKNWTDLSAKDFARVEEALADLVRQNPTSVPLRHHYAFVLARQQNWSAAEAQYVEILRLNPDAPVNFWLARALFNEHKYDESQRALNKDLQNASTSTPATSDLKKYLGEDLAAALKNANK